MGDLPKRWYVGRVNKIARLAQLAPDIVDARVTGSARAITLGRVSRRAISPIWMSSADACRLFDQLPQQPPSVRSGVVGHGAIPAVLLQHEVVSLSDDAAAIIWLAAINPALMNCSSGMVS